MSDLTAWTEELEVLASIEDGVDVCALELRRRLVALSDTPYSTATLIMRPSKDYPCTPLDVTLAEVRGLSLKEEKELGDRLNELTSELAEAESPAVFELCQETENYLTDHNEPKVDCIICYERPRLDELFRTECFHFFHRHCMARYVSHRRDNPHVEMSAELYQELRATHSTEKALQAALVERARQAPIGCPTCRAPVDVAQLEIVAANPQDEAFTPELSQKQRKEQAQRRQLFEAQLQRGGIIPSFVMDEGHDVIQIATPAPALSLQPTPPPGLDMPPGLGTFALSAPAAGDANGSAKSRGRGRGHDRGRGRGRVPQDKGRVLQDKDAAQPLDSAEDQRAGGRRRRGKRGRGAAGK